MKKQELTILKGQVERSNEQGQALLKLVESVEEIRDEMYKIHEEVKDDLQDIRDTYPLTNGEISLIKSMVSKKATEFTDSYFENKVSSELFSKKWGHFIMAIYFKLKRKFGVSTYTIIRHIDAEDAYQYIRNLEMADLPQRYLRMTEKQNETAEKYGDVVKVNVPEKKTVQYELSESK